MKPLNTDYWTRRIESNRYKYETNTETNRIQPDGGSGLLGGLLGGLFSKPTQSQVNQNVSYTHNISRLLIAYFN